MPKLFIASDSTASIKTSDKRPETGWGEHLETFLSPKIKVVNKALNGRSSKSFVEEGHLDVIDQEIQKEDYLIIQFGHNDQKYEDPNRYTDPNSTYKDYVLRYLLVAKKNGAHPILVSSITRRHFIDGKLDPRSVPNYPKAMQELAILQGVPFIDLYQITQKLLNQLGEQSSKSIYLHLEKGAHPNYPKGIEDDTHLSPYGAKLIASLIAQELKHII